MNAWWGSLSARDRRIASIGAALSLLLLGWALLWEPLQRSRDEWRERAIAADRAAAWMRLAAPQVAEHGAAPVAVNDGRSLLARVDAGARENGLGGVLMRVDPVSATEVRALFQQAPFDRLVDWLSVLGAQSGVRVEALSATRVSGVGLVDARVGLREGP